MSLRPLFVCLVIIGKLGLDFCAYSVTVKICPIVLLLASEISPARQNLVLDLGHHKLVYNVDRGCILYTINPFGEIPDCQFFVQGLSNPFLIFSSIS